MYMDVPTLAMLHWCGWGQREDIATNSTMAHKVIEGFKAVWTKRTHIIMLYTFLIVGEFCLGIYVFV